MRLYLIASVFFMALLSYGQDCKTAYPTALKAYQSEDYTNAIAIAENALKTCANADLKSKAYLLQVLTASAVDGDLGSRGIAFADQEIEAFKSLELNGKGHHEAIRKKGQLLMATAKHAEAAATFSELAALKKQRGDGDYLYWRTVADEGDAWLAIKKYASAIPLYEAALTGFKSLPDAGEDLLYSLFNLSFALNEQKEWARAATRLTEFISLVEKNNLKEIPEYEQARRMLSTINASAQGAGGGSGFLVAEDRIKSLLKSALREQGNDLAKAINHYDECEKLIVENKFVNNTSFSVYLNYARFLYALDRYEDARIRTQNAKAQAEQLFKPDQAEMAYAMVMEADLLLKDKRTDQAISLYKPAVTNLLNHPGGIWISQIRWVSEQLLIADQHQIVVDMLTPVVQSAPFNTVDVGERLHLLKLYTIGYIDLRQTQRVIDFFAPKTKTETDPAMKQGFMLYSAQALKEQGNWNEALATLKQAIQLDGHARLEGEIHYELGRLHHQLGEYKEAELTYQKAITEIADSPDAKMIAPQLYNSFATFYIQLGNYTAAEKLFKELLTNEESESRFYNSVRQNFASMYQQMGKYELAKSLLIKTVNSDRRLLGETHPDYGIALQNLAAVYQRTGKLDSATLLYEQALAIDKAYYGEQSVAYATKLANLAAVYQELKNFTKAKELFIKALSIRKNVLHNEHPDYAYNLYNVGYLLYRTNESAQAYPYFRECTAYYLRQIKDVFPVLSDYERTAFYNRIQPVIQSYETFMVEYGAKNPALAGELMNFRLETKALLLNTSIKVRNQILSSGNKELIGKFAVWQHTKEQLAYLYSLSATERKANQTLIDEYKIKANDLEKWLSVQSTGFGSSMTSTAVDWVKVKSALKTGEAALEVMRISFPSDSVLYAGLLVTPTSAQPQLILLDEGKKLDERYFKNYSNSMRFQQYDLVSYNKYWQKFDNSLSGVKMLYLSADGVFNKVNPLTFYNPQSKSYVIDNLQLQLCSNLKDLVELKRGAKAASSALLLGFPDYRLDAQLKLSDVDDNTRSSNALSLVLGNGIADLPGTGDEVSKIKSALTTSQWKTETFTRKEASEDIVKKASSPSLLHIATHGFFIGDGKKNSQQVFGNDLSNIENNVMLRSGLLLAGAEKNLVSRMKGSPAEKADDGVLTAFEVMNLNLDQTELVVLSACETGSGDIKNGEGVYGLQRAFMLAGAKSVIMSLWKVDDEATQFLMTEFYNKWLSGNDRAHAFYNSQLDIKKKYPHPYYWGAFVVTGSL